MCKCIWCIYITFVYYFISYSLQFRWIDACDFRVAHVKVNISISLHFKGKQNWIATKEIYILKVDRLMFQMTKHKNDTIRFTENHFLS